MQLTKKEKYILVLCGRPSGIKTQIKRTFIYYALSIPERRTPPFHVARVYYRFFLLVPPARVLSDCRGSPSIRALRLPHAQSTTQRNITRTLLVNTKYLAASCDDRVRFGPFFPFRVAWRKAASRRFFPLQTLIESLCCVARRSPPALVVAAQECNQVDYVGNHGGEALICPSCFIDWDPIGSRLNFANVFLSFSFTVSGFCLPDRLYSTEQ